MITKKNKNKKPDDDFSKGCFLTKTKIKYSLHIRFTNTKKTSFKKRENM